jgi:acyl-CoA dehydrogenase
MDDTALVAAIERIAVAHDRPAASPAAEQAKANAILDALAAERLVALVVPAAQGGPGAPIATAARAVAAVGRVSGSAGLIYAMHLSQLITVVRHARTEALVRFLERCVAEQLLLASATSEVGVGGNILKSLCQTEPDGDGFRLIKSCTNISYTDRAGVILATAMHAERGRAVQRLALLEAPHFAIRIDRESVFLGMRGIVNRAVTIEARFGADALFPEPFGVIARSMGAASHILWAALWSGLAAAALDRAQAALAGQAEGSPGAGRLAAANDRLFMMRALVRDACVSFDAASAGGPAFTQAARFNSLKIACAELLGEIMREATVLCGFRGYVEGTPESLSEILRDSLSAPIMVSNDRLSHNNAQLQRFTQDSI